MASDTTIGVNQQTKDRVAAMKREGETWDECVNRLLDEREQMEGVHDRITRLEEQVERLPDKIMDRLEVRFR
jgi:transcriptional regulator